MIIKEDALTGEEYININTIVGVIVGLIIYILLYTWVLLKLWGLL
jgi:hypothetical protein